jgi:hypothetical protein
MMNSPPVGIAQWPDSHLPSRIFGPCRSSRFAGRAAPDDGLRRFYFSSQRLARIAAGARRSHHRRAGHSGRRRPAGGDPTILVFDILAGYHDYSDIMPLFQVARIAIRLSGGSMKIRANSQEYLS